MDSFLTPYGLSNSGQEKLQFTPFWGSPKPGCSDGLCTGTIESHNFFCLRPYPGENSHSNSPNWELSNGVWVMALYWSKIVDPSSSPCLRTVQRKSFERGNFLVLRPALLKIAYFNSANRSLSIDIRHVELRFRKIVDPSRGAPQCSVERNFSKFSAKKLKEL